MQGTRNGFGPPADGLSPLADAARLVRAVEAGGAGAWVWRVQAGLIDIDVKLASLLGLAPNAMHSRKRASSHYCIQTMRPF
jgi:hypothetical protein